jgi:adenylate cyclase
MLTSKQLIEAAGISRATLNNYITMGLLEKPTVGPTGDGTSRAPRIGYFPDESLPRLEEIHRLKKEGRSMSEISSLVGIRPPVHTNSSMANHAAGQIAATKGLQAAPSALSEGDRAELVSPVLNEIKQNLATSGAALQLDAKAANPLRLTIENVEQPLYLVNNNFEIEWCNQEAADQVLGLEVATAEDITERNIFRAFVNNGPSANAESWDELIRFHLALAKNRLSRDELGKLRLHVGSGDMARIDTLYEEAEALGRLSLHNTEINLAPRGEEPRWYELHATFFREGIVFGYVPRGDDNNGLIALLSRREVVIRDLLRKRRPFLTPLAVVVADIQDSVKICAELPPEEYFELINDVWTAMEPLFRKYYATHGKHVGDGMVYYFFPQPDCNYLTNALHCAYEMQQTIGDVSRAWKARKNWGNDLLLNIGVDEGQEWFGTYQTPTHLEFTVLGDTINHVGRMSDFAREGSLWSSKRLLGRLTPDERADVQYGIKRQSELGEEIIVGSTYARINNLVDLDDPRNHKFNDIATMPVTEIINIDLKQG